MSVKLMGRVWELDLPHAQQSVALALADHGDDDGSSIYPSIGHVAWKVGYSDRQVQRIVAQLVELGMLVLVAEAVGHRAREYRMNTEAVPEKPPWNPRGDKLSPRHSDVQGVTSETTRGDIAMSPKPSEEPSGNHQTDADASVVPPAAATDPLSLEVDRLCKLMSEHLRTTHNVAAGSKEMRVARTWPGACRGLLAIDVCEQTSAHYTSAQVEYAIAYVTRSQYWRGRVKSMTRLRQEMPEIAKELHEKRARRDGGAQQDPLAGLSPEQRARMQRTAERAQRAYADQPPTPSGELNAPDHNVRALAEAC